MIPTKLITPAAQLARDELIAALGTEANPSQWMLFMSAVRKHLPDILSRGRPSIEAVQRSLIGQHGFSSWQEMVEAPVDGGGLGWSWSAWRQWSRAWRVVEDHQWLKDEPLTAAQVIAISEDIRKSGEPWPANADELAQVREKTLAAKKEQQAESLTALKDRVKTLENELSSAKSLTAQYQAQTEFLIQQSAEASEKLRESDQLNGQLVATQTQLNQKITELEQKLVDQDTLTKALDSSKQQILTLQSRLDQYRSMTRWERLKRVFSGD